MVASDWWVCVSSYVMRGHERALGEDGCHRGHVQKDHFVSAFVENVLKGGYEKRLMICSFNTERQ